jgi:uncharacterized membrane protein
VTKVDHHDDLGQAGGTQTITVGQQTAAALNLSDPQQSSCICIFDLISQCLGLAATCLR